MRYLVDSDWVIHYLNGTDRFRSRLDGLAAEGVAISVVTLGEVYDGIYRSPDPESEELDFFRFLAGCEILDLVGEICRLFGRERGRLEVAGMRIGDLDLLIGCTALYYGLTVLTNNRRHFERISGLNIISL